MRQTLLRESITRGLGDATRTMRSSTGILPLAALTALGFASSGAQAQDAQDAQDRDSQKLETITVTGSNIRRVDIETANPVVTIDRAQIERSGKLTVGDLLQALPAVTGGNVNPQVNNGGSYAGTASIGLRGLGSQRTLVLINGQRFLSGDPNAIPSNMIERIEVLTDGASSVYGSDAIAGVVNFILRSDYQGAEFRADYGISDRDDGERQGYHFTFGQSSDRGSIMGGVDYNHQDQILAGHRPFGKFARDLTASTSTPPYTFIGGSSSPAPGRIVLPADSAFAEQFGCTQISINPGADGQTVDANNYHCFGNSDKFNYADINLVLTPQERTSAFMNGNYKLTDNVEAYATVLYSKTSSSSQLAPAIIGTNPPGILVISPDSYYNPFGIQFGGGGSTYQLRAVAAGPRRTNATVNYGQFNGGFKGNLDIGSQNWTWDAGFGYGHVSLLAQKFGLPNFNVLNLDLGPSYYDAGLGRVVCGTPEAPILTGCTPFNIFDSNNGNDPAAVAAISAAALPAQNTHTAPDREIRARGRVGRSVRPSGRHHAARSRRFASRRVHPHAGRLAARDRPGDRRLYPRFAVYVEPPGRLHGEGGVRRALRADPEGSAVLPRVERDAGRPLLEVLDVRRHQQLEGAGRVASDRGPPAPWHRVEGVPRADHRRRVRRTVGQRADTRQRSLRLLRQRRESERRQPGVRRRSGDGPVHQHVGRQRQPDRRTVDGFGLCRLPARSGDGQVVRLRRRVRPALARRSLRQRRRVAPVSAEPHHWCRRADGARPLLQRRDRVLLADHA
jgi:hypothetical protein